MADTSNKFFIIASFVGLGFCCFLSVWFFLISTVVRNRDIEHYKLTADVAVSNIVFTTQRFLELYITNHVSYTPSGEASKSSGQMPTVKNFSYGYSNYPRPCAIIDGAYIFGGDYMSEGLVISINERSIYCMSATNTVTIIRNCNPRASSPAQRAGDEDAPGLDSY